MHNNIAGIIKVPNEIITICNYQSLKSENDSIDLNSTNPEIYNAIDKALSEEERSSVVDNKLKELGW